MKGRVSIPDTLGLPFPLGKNSAWPVTTVQQDCNRLYSIIDCGLLSIFIGNARVCQWKLKINACQYPGVYCHDLISYWISDPYMASWNGWNGVQSLMSVWSLPCATEANVSTPQSQMLGLFPQGMAVHRSLHLFCFFLIDTAGQMRCNRSQERERKKWKLLMGS